MTSITERLQAVLEVTFETDVEDLDVSTYDERYIEGAAGDYFVGTYAEAMSACYDYVEETLWAFDSSFLSGFMPDGIGAAEIEAIRGDRCESANPALEALVRAGGYSIAEVAEQAVGYDGMGHFLASYDGEEREASNGLLVFRTN